MLVGKKTCRLKKQTSVGEFPLPKTDMSRMSRIPCNARPKNGRGGKKSPRAYRWREKEKSSSFGKKKCFVGWKNKMLVGKKTCRLKNKCRFKNFPRQKRTCPECLEFPGMQDRKTAEAGKKRPRAYRGKKRGGNSSFGKKMFLWVDKTKCWLEKKLVG